MDRITELRIENVRAVESVTMRMGRSVTVLIGENGSCKSTVLECLEVLRRAAHGSFLNELYRVHGGLPALLRKGAPDLTLGVTVEDDAGTAPTIRYAFTLAPERSGAAIRREALTVSPDPSTVDPQSVKLAEGAVPPVREAIQVVSRSPGGAMVHDPGTRSPKRYSADASQLVLSALEGPAAPPGVERLLRMLRGIEVHVGFDTVPSWVARTLQRPVTVRGASVLFPATRLQLLGGNLANAWSELKNRGADDVDESMNLVRLGLGSEVDSVVVPPDQGGGNVYLGVRFRGLPEPVLAADLSDGQLAWLSFVAMARLGDDRSLLAVDEPELHLHPSLLGRVVSLLSNLPGGAPVVLSTHSDRVLEILEDPLDSVRVCRRQGVAATVSELDAEQLGRWLREYGDLGQLRAAGYLHRVVANPPPSGS